MKPTPLAPTPWEFPNPRNADRYGVVGVGADLEPSTLIGAYRAGLFPMPAGRDGLIAWWSPDPRGVIELESLRRPKSLRRSLRRYDVTLNTAFDRVIAACADERRPGGWISDRIIAAYCELHRLGWAHSIEVWNGSSLVGGLYGVQVAGLFAGESMFHTETDASKVALVRLVELMKHAGAELLDVQWCTEHLSTLGASEVRRDLYLSRLATAVSAKTTSLSEISVDWLKPFSPNP